MKVVKCKTGCFCHNCDNKESEYTISNNGSFKMFWAKEATDCEISFCEDCVRDLFGQLSVILN